MQNFEIRKAGPADIDAVATLFDLYRQFYQQPADVALAKQFIGNRINRDESTILVAIQADEAMLGFCQLYPSFCSVIAEPILVLYDLFVIASARKVGAGRGLLIAAESHAKRVGAKRMDLTTAKDNIAAQTLYESLGWERDEVFFTYCRDC